MQETFFRHPPGFTPYLWPGNVRPQHFFKFCGDPPWFTPCIGPGSVRHNFFLTYATAQVVAFSRVPYPQLFIFWVILRAPALVYPLFRARKRTTGPFFYILPGTTLVYPLSRTKKRTTQIFFHCPTAARGGYPPRPVPPSSYCCCGPGSGLPPIKGEEL